MSKNTSIKKIMLKTIYDYNMIQPGDKIMIAISGGKDSFTLLRHFQKIRHESGLRHDFEFQAVYVKPGNDQLKDLSDPIEEYCQKIDVDYRIQDLKIPKDSQVRDGIEKLETCQRCAYGRRITLMKLAEKLGANKLAYGHHMDDIITTLMLNIQMNNKMQAMPPVNEMREGNLNIIRPLAKIREKQIKDFVKNTDITPLDNNCPLKNQNQRDQLQEKLKDIEKKHFPDFIKHMYRAYMKKFGHTNMD